MTTTTTKNKLSARKDRVFKKPSSSLHNARAATVLKKAFELSELCGIEVCIIWYDREGNLVMTWPEKEEEGKVEAMAERYSMLSEQERNKKSNNLSGFLNKKMIRDKKESLRKRDNKFSQQVSELEDSLQSCLHTLQESLHLDLDQPHELSSNDSTLINVEASLLSCVDDVSTTTTSSMNHHQQSNFSILLYNHDDGTFTRLGNSSALPSFEQQPQIPCDQDCGYLDLLLGEQGMRGCNNFDLLPTSPTLVMQTQQAYDNQIPYFGMMLS